MSTTASTSEESLIDTHSDRALARTRRNLRYLYSPSTSPSSPSSRRTRVFLRLIRSSLIFVFWRLVRYAKYVAIGSLIATLGAGAFGTVVSGAGFVLAPTGIMGTVLAGSVWGVGRVVLKRVGRRWDRRGVDEEEDEEMAVEEGGRGFEVDAMPW
ncbi:hypothetical protein BKA63DRAFT_585887 [Paraphoma chrysanthemicola]|nr:hypothetical protein BKA63DRAFT_585887 [Paraphoma chrysanthemicola]